VRLKPEDKEFFVQVTEESGLEPGIAARTILELMIKHLRDDRNFFEALGDLQRALKERREGIE
jgi:hypothetical protein